MTDQTMTPEQALARMFERLDAIDGNFEWTQERDIIRAALSRPAVPAGITVWLEGKRLARVVRKAPESSGDSESRAAFAQLAMLAASPEPAEGNHFRDTPKMAERAWIAVSERLPEEGLCVLLACEYADAPVVGYQKHGMWWADTEHHEVSCGAYCYGGKVIGCLKDSRVTHWMPLPAPPGA